MSIQRYDILHPKMRDKGRFVLYADHIADKDADLHHLLSTLADIRIALGVGEKPMLSELAGIVRTRMGVIKILEREAKENAAEVERLTAERDALDTALDQANADTEETRKEMVQWREWCIKAQAERDAAVVAKDVAVEALRILQQAEKTYREKYNTYGHNSFEARDAYDKLHDAGYSARVALTKIEGEQNATR